MSSKETATQILQLSDFSIDDLKILAVCFSVNIEIVVIKQRGNAI